MTVEAAFIIPWVMFIFVWLIYLGYFEYDRCLLFQDNYCIATQAAGQIKITEEKNRWLKSQLSSGIKKKYMGAKSISFDGNVSEKEIKINSQVVIEHPLVSHANMIPTSNWDISDTVRVDNYSFTKRLRIQRGIERMMGEVFE